jgi:hypothetical protein
MPVFIESVAGASGTGRKNLQKKDSMNQCEEGKL